MDLNKCNKCKTDLVIGGSGTICCVNDDCDVEVIGIIYNEPITIEEQYEKLLIPHVSQQSELLERLDKLENWAYNKANEDDLKFLNSIYRSDNCG